MFQKLQPLELSKSHCTTKALENPGNLTLLSFSKLSVGNPAGNPGPSHNKILTHKPPDEFEIFFPHTILQLFTIPSPVCNSGKAY